MAGIVLVLVAVGASKVFGGDDGEGGGTDAAANGGAAGPDGGKGETASPANAERRGRAAATKTTSTAVPWAKTGLAPDRPSPTTAGSTRPRRATRGATRSPACSPSGATRPAPTTAQGPVPTGTRGALELPGASGGCAASRAVGGEAKTWCGTGWTGQPSVWEDATARTWVAFGAYDKDVHFLDADDRRATSSPPFPTGDIIKGSVTVDPDGFPLLYSGSAATTTSTCSPSTGASRPRSCGRCRPTTCRPTKWNNDWDGSPPRHRRLPLRGRREQPVPHREAQPGDGRRRQGHGRPRARLQRARAGTTSCSTRHRRPATTSRSRTRSPSPATPSTSPTPAAWSRAGTSPAWPTGQTPTADVPVLDRRRHRRLDRRRRRGDALRRRPSTSAATSPVRTRSAS